MRTSISLVIAIVGFVTVLNYVIAVEEMTCKAFVASLTKRQLTGIQECNKKLGLKSSKDKKEKMNCVLKCIMQKEGLLNDEGLFDDSSFDGFLEKEMPPNLMPQGGPLFRNCKDTAGPKLDPKEDNCKSYDVLIKCFMGVITELCKVA